MTMQVTCPCCATRFPLDAGFADADGKRLAALFADMEPALGRATLAYLRLFKPARQQLRSARAAKIVEALVALVRAGTVCRDERGGVRRPAAAAVWAAGIEQMLADAGKLTLPLSNHHYLRAIVYGLADKADAAAERARETALRQPARAAASARREPDNALHESLMRIEADLSLKLIDAAEAKRRRAETRASHREAH